ncbi:ImpA family type VI secretion system protein [Serratia fonticola]|uniref:type VI secretion system protein TssA n=1 Tax=Serratia fonticola TaxID=47917 RepID=UPI003BB5AD82
MDNAFSQALLGVEFDPIYIEIEAMLAQQDESADPLSMPNDPPRINWQLVAEQSGKLLDQCCDLRVSLWLIRANMQREGISALFLGLVDLDNRIVKMPDSLYPISEVPPLNSGHAAALGWLSTAQCIAELKSARLTTDLPFTVQELNENESGRSFAAVSPQLLHVNSCLQKSGLPDLLEQFNFISNALKRVEDYANQHSEGYQLDCEQLHAFLDKCIVFLSKTNNQNVNNNITHHGDVTSLESPPRTLMQVDDIHLRTRQEIILMLDRILEYFQHYEPSHPAPIFIRRTKQMIGMDFISIVEDLLPESLLTLQQFTGK